MEKLSDERKANLSTRNIVELDLFADQLTDCCWIHSPLLPCHRRVQRQSNTNEAILRLTLNFRFISITFFLISFAMYRLYTHIRLCDTSLYGCRFSAAKYSFPATPENIFDERSFRSFSATTYFISVLCQ